MRTALLASCVILLSSSFTFGDEKEELAKFKGKWTASSISGNGQDVPEKVLKDDPFHWSIDGAKIISKRPVGGGKIVEEELSISVDPTQKMKTIDMTDVKKKEVSKGIYELEGDTLKLCIQMDPKGERPTDFTSKAGSNRIVIVWKKVKE